MSRIITFDVPYPAPDRVEAVAEVLRAAGWNPTELGALGEILGDLLMILGAAGREPEVADYLRTVDSHASSGSLESYLSLAAAVIRAYHGEASRHAV